ncbi:MAG TPA: hypothetical protein VK307_01520 [Thermoleophilaceae bacterium]|nr:hypothetical protein [Thermoleophilaceae bacterium]
MSGEERQRELREQGSRPAEAQKEDEARRGREALRREQAQQDAGEHRSPDEPAPMAERDADRPAPRR